MLLQKEREEDTCCCIFFPIGQHLIHTNKFFYPHLLGMIGNVNWLVYMFWGFFAILFCLLKNICLDKRLPFCYYKINLVTQLNKIKIGEDLMKKHLIAHVRRDRSTGEVIAIQSLKEHSRNVAVFCSENCRVANLSKTGEVVGLPHDGGKSSEPGQTHLEEGTRERVNHSSAGMRYIWERCKEKSRLTGQLISLAIGCHHSGRNDYMSLDGRQPWLEQMYSKQANSLYPESIAAFISRMLQ